MQIIPKKGTVTIDGRTDLKTYYRFSSNFDNFNINEIWDVVSFTQSINQEGYQSIINYNKQPFSLTKKITDLESAVF